MADMDKPKEIVLANLLQVIGDSDFPLSARELRALSGLDRGDRERFWPAWRRIEAERRGEIARTMVEIAEDNVDLDFGEPWYWLLEDDNPEVRSAALEGMWEDETPRAMRRTLELLRDDPSADVRAIAALALSRFANLAALGELDGDVETLERELLRSVRDADEPLDVRRRALESVGYFCDSDDAQAEIERAYSSNEQLLRESALTAMGRSMLPGWLPVVERELGSASPAMRYEAAHAAGEMADVARPLLPRLLKMLEESDTEVVLAVIWALGQVGGDAARRALQRISRGNDPARSEAAEEALQELDLNELPE